MRCGRGADLARSLAQLSLREVAEAAAERSGGGGGPPVLGPLRAHSAAAGSAAAGGACRAVPWWGGREQGVSSQSACSLVLLCMCLTACVHAQEHTAQYKAAWSNQMWGASASQGGVLPP